jgi:hypothetical protein
MQNLTCAVVDPVGSKSHSLMAQGNKEHPIAGRRHIDLQKKGLSFVPAQHQQQEGSTPLTLQMALAASNCRIVGIVPVPDFEKQIAWRFKRYPPAPHPTRSLDPHAESQGPGDVSPMNCSDTSHHQILSCL